MSQHGIPREERDKVERRLRDLLGEFKRLREAGPGVSGLFVLPGMLPLQASHLDTLILRLGQDLAALDALHGAP